MGKISAKAAMKVGVGPSVKTTPHLPLASLLMTLIASAALVLPEPPSFAAAQAPTPVPRAMQKRAAESERNHLQQKLDGLKRAIENTEGEKNRAADDLAKSESAISKANRSLSELGTEQAETQKRLSALAQQIRQQKAVLATRQAQLASLLRQQHSTNKEEPIPLLLSGEEPASVARSLRYLDYVAQAQAKLLGTIREELHTVEQDQAQLQAASAELDEIASESKGAKLRLEQEQAQRAKLMGKLSGQLASQRAEAGVVQRDESRLGSLVEQLGKLIAQQQKAEALAAEKRRLQVAQRAAQKAAQRAAQIAAKEAAHIAAQKAKHQALAQQTAEAKVELRRQASNPNAIDDDVPDAATESGKATASDQSVPKATLSTTFSAPLSSTFSTLKGQLRMPVKGELINRFGTRRNDGPNWKGLFIAAPQGAQIHAVAAGQVVFADWLRGFGNLIIVDHGGQYLSIYGNNEAVLKYAGDQVAAGDVIASSGNTGGNAQSGLYFEMRFQGRAFDPLGWVTSR